jgi:hypothetical protein
MTLPEIQSAVNAGRRVFWKHRGYEVIKDNLGQWMVKCHLNSYCWGLTWANGTTMNGKPDDFFAEDIHAPRFSTEAILRTRRALKDDAAGNVPCTMTDLDLACDMLDELIKFQTQQTP